MFIRPALAADLPGLAALLVEAVAGGASIGFMAGFDGAAAQAWWQARLAAMARGELLVLTAHDTATVIGTVTLALAMPPNQPHRGDVQKLIVAANSQRRGVAAALMAALEREARRMGRHLLVLDTISDSGAAQFYAACGWTRAGEIPDYALMPGGGLAPTTIFFKRLQSRR